MKSGNRDNNKEAACNEEAGVALVGVHSEYPRYVRDFYDKLPQYV
jgi:hypothetical protein